MSLAENVYAALSASLPLKALVGANIAQNAVPQGAAMPIVVFTTSTQSLGGLLDDDLVQATISLQCWAKTALQASAVADAAEAAIAAWELAHPLLCAHVTERAGTFDPELGLDAEELTVDWIDQTPG